MRKDIEYTKDIEFITLLNSLYYKDQMNFWKEYFSGELKGIKLPLSFNKSENITKEISKAEIEISEKSLNTLSKLCNNSESLISVILLSASNYLIYKYTNQTDLIIITPIQKEFVTEKTLNDKVLIRTKINKNQTLKDFILDCKKNFNNSYNNQDYPSSEIVKSIPELEDIFKSYYSQIYFAYSSVHKEHQFASISNEIYISFKNEENKLKGTLYYNSHYHNKFIVENLAFHIGNFISNVEINLNKNISEIVILTNAEKKKLLIDFNSTKTDFPKDKSINILLDEQVERTPDNVALVLNSEFITYSYLNSKVNQLTYEIRNYGAKERIVIGIIAERSVEMIVGILSIMKSGAAYLPIDSNYPKERIQYMINDANIGLILSGRQSLYIQSNRVDQRIIDLQKDSLYNNIISTRINSSADPAYVIYTSGSTGTPKGVLVNHRSLINTLYWNIKYYEYEVGDSILQIPSISFDASVENIFATLIYGLKLILINEESKYDVVLLSKIIKNLKITSFPISPKLYSELLNYIDEKENSLKKISIVGENFTISLVERHFSKLPNVRLFNGYGPTENSICSTIFEFRLDNKQILIGNPIFNVSCYVLNEDKALQQIGVTGELYLSGEGLAEGYLNDPDLTAERFMNHPFRNGERIYRTGDLARWLPDGNLEFLGRIDNQLKIRGFRIEPQEIENALLLHKNIRDCAVIVRDENDDKVLCAYIVYFNKQNSDDIKDYLTGLLPDYMVPHFFVELENIPLSINGKIDHKALPAPEQKVMLYYQAPSNELEIILQGIWQEVLGFKQISVTDNFFDLGGDSIKAIQISSKLHTIGYKITVKSIFKYPVFKDLCKNIQKLDENINQEILKKEIPLSPIQTWFFNNRSKNHNHYNQSIILKFKGEIKENDIRKIFNKIQEHHCVFNIVFKKNNNVFLQENKDIPSSLSLKIFDFKNQKITNNQLLKEANKIQSSINISNGPLMNLGLFYLAKETRLLIVIHHLIVDGISWRILLEDIELLYQQIINKKVLALPPKTSSFQTWAYLIQDYLKTPKFKKACAYWLQIDKIMVFQLPKDFDSGSNRIKDTSYKSFALSANSTNLLLKKVNSAYNTQINDILITAFYLSIKEVFGLKKVIIDMESHGREGLSDRYIFNRTVGWFTSFYPIVIGDDENTDLDSFIKKTKEALRVPNQGIDYCIYKYFYVNEIKNDFEVNSKVNSKAQVSFNYLGQFDTDAGNKSFDIITNQLGETISEDRERDYDLEVTGIISYGQLQFGIKYSKFQYKSETIQKLLDNFQLALLKVIEHCISCKNIYYSPSDFLYKELSIKQVDKLQEEYSIEDIYRLSPMQEGMLYHALLEPNTSLYFEQQVFSIKGEFNSDIIRKVLNIIVSRHDILRTIFLYEGYDHPLQVVLKNRDAEFIYKDIENEVCKYDKKQVIDKHISIDFEKKFDLSKDKLMRLTLLKITKDQYELIWSFHHILMDRWCLDIILNEFFALYNSEISKTTINLNKPVPYKNYIEWLVNQDEARAIKHWQKYLHNFEKITDLPCNNKIKTEKETEQSFSHFKLSDYYLDQIKKLSFKNNLSISMIIHTIWGLLLSKYNDSIDVIFGTVVTGRPPELRDVDLIVGLFINTIPLRFDCNPEKKVNDLFKDTMNAIIENDRFSYLSLAQIQSQSQIKNTLFNQILIYENAPVNKTPDNSHFNNKIEFNDFRSFEKSNYDLNITINVTETINFKITYNPDLYTDHTIGRIEKDIKSIADQIFKNPEIEIKDISILSEVEKVRILQEFNATSNDYKNEIHIISMFEERVLEFPDRISIVSNDIHISYKELNIRSNVLANSLCNFGYNNKNYIPILFTRCPDLIITSLSIMKLGLAYVPLDNDWPINRIKEVLEDVNNDFFISNIEDSAEEFKEFNPILFRNIPEIRTKNNIDIDIDIDNPLYVIYTSGSTGRPKGAINIGRGITNRFLYMNKRYLPQKDDVVLLTSNHVFDASVWQMFWPLTNGLKSVIPIKSSIFDLDNIFYIIYREFVSITDFVPSVFNLMVDTIEGNPILEKKISSLRQLLIGGEAMNSIHIYKFKRINPKASITNTYGPAEASIGTVFFELPEEHIESIPIGKPIDNVISLILDQNKKLSPIGISGELYLGGKCLGLGYLNNPDLTNEVFAFINEDYFEGQLFYKTGDLAKYLPDGNIEFLGRKDTQIKIRGVRIELEEIKSRLLKHELIKETEIIYFEINGRIDLAAFYVSINEIKASELRGFLLKVLLEPMVPKYFIQIENIPLTVNGKVDRNKLKEILHESTKQRIINTPKTNIEKIVLNAWKRVLNVQQIDINDNFFEIGGNSLDLVRLNGILTSELEMNNLLIKLIQYPTVKSFSEFTCSNIDEKKQLSSVEENNHENRNVEVKRKRNLQRGKRKGLDNFQLENYETHAMNYSERVINRDKYKFLDVEDEIINKIITNQNINDFDILVDAGCGTGDRLRILFEKRIFVKENINKIDGIDFSKKMLEYAEKQTIDNVLIYSKLYNEDLINIKSDINGDVVICLWSIVNECISSFSGLLNCLSNLVKPNGYLIFEVTTKVAQSVYATYDAYTNALKPELKETLGIDDQTFLFQREDETMAAFKLYSLEEINTFTDHLGMNLIEVWGYNHSDGNCAKVNVTDNEIRISDHENYSGFMLCYKKNE